MGVEIRGRGFVPVTQPLAHHRKRVAPRQQQGGVSVAQVVQPGACGQPCAPECRFDPAVQRADLQRPSHGVGEHQVSVAVVIAQQVAYRRLPCVLLPQGRQAERTELHDAHLMGLGRSEHEPLARHWRQAAAHHHEAAVEINICPAQTQKLTAPQPAEHRQNEQRVDRLGLIGRQQTLHRRLVEHGDGAFGDARQFDGIGCVAGRELPCHRLGQRFVDDRMDQMHRGRREALLECAVA